MMISTIYLQFFPDLYIYIMLFQFWHSTCVNVRSSYHFRAILLWMLSSLFLFSIENGYDGDIGKKGLKPIKIPQYFLSYSRYYLFVFFNIKTILLFDIRVKKLEEEGVKYLCVPIPRTLCQLSIGSLKIDQYCREYKYSQVAENNLLAD